MFNDDAKIIRGEGEIVRKNPKMTNLFLRSGRRRGFLGNSGKAWECLGFSGNVWENLGVVGRMLEISRSFLGVSLVRKKSQKNLIGNNH